MEKNINETNQENKENSNKENNADVLNNKEAENNKPDYKEFTVSLSSIDYEGPLSILFDMLNISRELSVEPSLIHIISKSL